MSGVSLGQTQNIVASLPRFIYSLYIGETLKGTKCDFDVIDVTLVCLLFIIIFFVLLILGLA